MQLSFPDFLRLRRELPVIDVRSEGEFEAGHIRGAINIPLLNNAERVVVGTAYKQHGQRQAIHEGFRLVGPRLESLITEAEKVAARGEAIVHCWRGGMRSANFAQFIGMAGISSHVLAGGYKTYRQAALDMFREKLSLVSVTGCTGSGKSDVLRELARQGEQVLDLERLANHKGSAFGHLLQPPQPKTEQFQNELYEQLLTLDRSRRIWVEDESIAIGKIFLPPDFWNQLHQAPLVRMEVPRPIRVSRLVEEYSAADRDEFLAIMAKISKKLGGQHFLAARERLQQNDWHAVIDILLNYYDKAYVRSMERRNTQLKFSLPWDGTDITAYARQLIQQV
ncbi:MAG: tRNA 2-selenouridine(34) synthase MnmH [Cyclobacteriaceae bacterium]|nr:tRNA 2-selenouridine(34) synthase MnmH [Cyclobacteriaceae bacterium]